MDHRSISFACLSTVTNLLVSRESSDRGEHVFLYGTIRIHCRRRGESARVPHRNDLGKTIKRRRCWPKVARIHKRKFPKFAYLLGRADSAFSIHFSANSRHSVLISLLLDLVSTVSLGAVGSFPSFFLFSFLRRSVKYRQRGAGLVYIDFFKTAKKEKWISCFTVKENIGASSCNNVIYIYMYISRIRRAVEVSNKFQHA